MSYTYLVMAFGQEAGGEVKETVVRWYAVRFPEGESPTMENLELVTAEGDWCPNRDIWGEAVRTWYDYKGMFKTKKECERALYEAVMREEVT